MNKTERLKQHISAGETQQALAIINSNANPADYPGYSFSSPAQLDHQFAKDVFSTVLKGTSPNTELVDAALVRFAKTRESGRHGYWVHSLSHLTTRLWELGLKDQIKRLNEIAFIGANEFGDNNCCNRLVRDFLYRAPWDANPAEYGLTKENLRWALVPSKYSGDNTEPEDGKKMLEQLARYPFASKEEWKTVTGRKESVAGE